MLCLYYDIVKTYYVFTMLYSFPGLALHYAGLAVMQDKILRFCVLGPSGDQNAVMRFENEKKLHVWVTGFLGRNTFFLNYIFIV